ncbi:MAG: transketolase family protein [Oscillospiraceae bacterium]|jgi:transketolase|nr:transketolase family protein [Oscillospiraceae bacterium]
MIEFGERRDTNATYGATLTALAKENSNIVVVEADLMKASGSAVFKVAFPERMFNVGIAEQDALSFSAGLAAMGKIPFVSGFACFMAQRACDQAMNSIAYNKYNVKVVGTYAGLTSEKNGGTHISVSDLAIYRAMPGFLVIDPGDANEFAAVLRFASEYDGPVYIRSNKGVFPTFLPEDSVFKPGKAIVLSDGADVGLITCGIATAEGVKATAMLNELGIGVRHIHMPTVKPLDTEELIRTAKQTRLLITVENHSVIGGLGGAVAEVLCAQFPAKLIRLGLQDHFGETATLGYMMHEYGIDADAIASSAEKAMNA